MKLELLKCEEMTTRYTIKWSGKQIINMIRKHSKVAIPDNATVSFHVPRGGDWSDTEIEIDNENVAWVQWSTSEVKDERA